MSAVQVHNFGPPIGEVSLSGLKDFFARMDWATPPDTAIFNSGPHTQMFYPPIERREGLTPPDIEKNVKSAGETFSNPRYAAHTKPIAQTKGGKLWQSIYQGIPFEWRDEVDLHNSLLFARAVQGSVVAFLEGGESRPLFFWEDKEKLEEKSDVEKRRIEPSLDPAKLNPSNLSQYQESRTLSVWLRAELPALLANSKVTSINGVNILELRTFYESQKFEEVALVTITRKLAQAFHRNQPFKLPGVPPFGSVPPDPSGTGVMPAMELKQLPSLATSSSAQLLSPPKTDYVASPFTTDPKSLFKKYGVLPGGVLVKPTQIDLPVAIHSLEVDQISGTNLIVNGKLIFQTDLLPEEVASLFSRYTDIAEKLHNKTAALEPAMRQQLLQHEAFNDLLPGIGALSTKQTVGLSESGIVGGVLRDADRHLGSVVFSNTGRINALKLTASSDLESPRRKLSEDLDITFSVKNTAVIHEIEKVSFAVQGDTFYAHSIRSSLGIVSFREAPTQPEFLNSQSGIANQNIEGIINAKFLPLLQRPSYRRVFRYAEVLALLNASLVTQPNGLKTSRSIEKYRTDPTVLALGSEVTHTGAKSAEENEIKAALRNNLLYLQETSRWDAFLVAVGVCFVQATKLGNSQAQHDLEGLVRRKICEISPPLLWNNPIDRRLVTLAARLSEGRFSLSTSESGATQPLSLKRSSISLLTLTIESLIERGLLHEATGAFRNLPKSQGKLSDNQRQTIELSSTFKLGRLLRTLLSSGNGYELSGALLTGLAEQFHVYGLDKSTISWQSLTLLSLALKERISPNLNIQLYYFQTFNMLPLKESKSMAAALWSALLVAQIPDTQEFQQLRETSEALASFHLAQLKADRGDSAEPQIKELCEIALAMQFLMRSPEPVQPIFREEVKGFDSSMPSGRYRLALEEVITGKTKAGAASAIYDDLVAIGKNIIQREVKGGRTLPSAIAKLLRTIYQEKDFGVGEVILLTDALLQKQLDCDTSAFLCFDILEASGYSPALVVTPEHAFIKLDNYYIETVQGTLLGRESFENRYGGIDVYVSNSRRFLASIAHTELLSAIRRLESDPARAAERKCLTLTKEDFARISKETLETADLLWPNRPDILRFRYSKALREKKPHEQARYEAVIRKAVDQDPNALFALADLFTNFPKKHDALAAKARIVASLIAPTARSTFGGIILTQQSSEVVDDQISANSARIVRILAEDLSDPKTQPRCMAEQGNYSIQMKVGDISEQLQEIQLAEIHGARSECVALTEMRRVNLLAKGLKDDLYQYSLQLWLQPARFDIRVNRARSAFDLKMMSTVKNDLYDSYASGPQSVQMPAFLLSALTMLADGKKAAALLRSNGSHLDQGWAAAMKQHAELCSSPAGAGEVIVAMALELYGEERREEAQAYLKLLTPEMMRHPVVESGWLAIAQISQSESIAEVERRFSRAIELGCDRRTALLTRALNFVQLWDYDIAKEAFESPELKNISSEAVLFCLTSALTRSSRAAQQIDFYRECLSRLGDIHPVTIKANALLIERMSEQGIRIDLEHDEVIRSCWNTLAHDGAPPPDELKSDISRLVECNVLHFVRMNQLSEAERTCKFFAPYGCTTPVAEAFLAMGQLSAKLPWLLDIALEGRRSIKPYTTHQPPSEASRW